MILIKKFIDKTKNEGFVFALNRVFSYIKHILSITNKIDNQRKRCGVLIDESFNSTVRYGPFKGLKLSSDNWWGSGDRASMLLGLYEQEVLESLTNIPKNYRTFIDLGAADGYYSIGVLINNLFDRSYCFEMSEKGRNIIREKALINGVSDNILIHGIADKDFYRAITSDQLSNSVLFVDIEGGEFDLFSKELFRIFKESIIFIELHDWFFKDGKIKLAKLRNDAEEFFCITELTTSTRDLSGFPELEKFSDTDRWLICSEGRARLMTWYRLDPRQ